MCLTLPAKIISLNNNTARVKINHQERQIKSAIADLKTGDWVLVNADLAVEKISKREASAINKLIN